MRSVALLLLLQVAFQLLHHVEADAVPRRLQENPRGPPPSPSPDRPIRGPPPPPPPPNRPPPPPSGDNSELPVDGECVEEEVSIGKSIFTTTVPAFAMVLGEVVVYFHPAVVQVKVQAIFQNLSAGILLSAIAGELFPRILHAPNAEGFSGSLAILAGATLGLSFFLGLEHFLDDDDETEQPPMDKEEGLQGSLQGDLSGTEWERVRLQYRQLNNSMQSMERIWGLADTVEQPGTDAEGVVLARPPAPNETLVVADVVSNPLDQQGTASEDVRDLTDKQLHLMMHYVHAAERALKGAGEYSTANRRRVREHLGELRGNLIGLNGAITNDTDLANVSSALKKVDGTLQHLHNSHVERATFRRWRPIHVEDLDEDEGSSWKTPWSVVTCVAIDGAVDGFLIGLALLASAKAGLLMSFATCLEMGFLGVSYSSTLRQVRDIPQRALLAALPPLLLVVFGVIPSFVGDAARDNAHFFVAAMSFATVALLYLLTQELLAEVIEASEEGMWYITIWLFIGVFSVITLDRSMVGSSC